MEQRYAIYDSQTGKCLWEDHMYRSCAKMFFALEDLYEARREGSSEWIGIVDRSVHPRRFCSVVLED